MFIRGTSKRERPIGYRLFSESQSRYDADMPMLCANSRSQVQQIGGSLYRIILSSVGLYVNVRLQFFDVVIIVVQSDVEK